MVTKDFEGFAISRASVHIYIGTISRGVVRGEGEEGVDEGPGLSDHNVVKWGIAFAKTS